MTDAPLPPPRILIVEDEDDWGYLMRRALEDEADERQIHRPEINIALNAEDARRLMTRHHYHLMSFDMRLPTGKGDSEISVASGVGLTRSLGLQFGIETKTIIYSATLDEEYVRETPYECMAVAQLAPEKYAKSSGAASASTSAPIETLSPREWAKRVLDYLNYDQCLLEFHPASGSTKSNPKESALGAWLHGATLGLPPALARLAQELRSDWPLTKTHSASAGAIHSALRFIESSLRLAVAQTAVLIGLKPANCGLPDTNNQKDFMTLLRGWTQTHGSALSGWTWRSDYLTDAAIDAFDETRDLRNEARHTLGANTARTEWNRLYPLLLQIMNVSSYWAKHPLVTDLRFVPGDGWKGQILRGTGYPGLLERLSGKDFPGTAISGIWQLPPHLTANGQDCDEFPLCWDDWLQPDPHDARPLWLAILASRNRQQIKGWDLIDGERLELFPTPD